MKFWIPGHEGDAGGAEERWQAVKRFAEADTTWSVSDERIARLDYVHAGRSFTAEVGQIEPRTGGLVLVILRSNTYLVCTPNHGVEHGDPLFAGVHEATHVEHFDSYAPEAVAATGG